MRLSRYYPLPRNAGTSKPTYRNAFLRSVGLDAFNSLIIHLFGTKNLDEPKKRIASPSFWTALQRCGVHLLPSAVSLVVISLNLKGYFIGFELAGVPGQTSLYMALLQVAAKVQELLIVGSLATVVVHRLRHDLIDGPGVPFGLVGATSLFAQLNFFWSPPFLGSLPKRLRLNAVLLVLILVSGFIAAIVGPAVAVLLIPREQNWDAGGSTFWVNGSVEEIWPARVDMEHYTVSCNTSTSYTNQLCPSGGYQSLVQRLASGYRNQARSGARDAQYSPMTRLLGSGSGSLVVSPPGRGQMQIYTALSSQRGSMALESSAFAVHGPASWIASQIGDNWYDAAMSAPNDPRVPSSRYKYYSSMLSSVDTKLPAVRVVCSSPQTVRRGQNQVQFPIMPEFAAAFVLADQKKWESGVLRESKNITVDSRLFLDRSPSLFPKISRLPLTDPALTSTTGLLIEYPWDANNNSRAVSGCIVDPRWAQGVVFYEYDSAPQPAIQSFIDNNTNEYLAADLFRPTNTSDWSRIDITSSLFTAINFPLPASMTSYLFSLAPSTSTPSITALEALLLLLNPSNTWTSNPQLPQIEHAFALLFADALARSNAWRLNPTKPYPVRLPDWKPRILRGEKAFTDPPGGPAAAAKYTTFRMRQNISGYSYALSSTTDYLALTVLFAHLAIATGHTLFLLIFSRRSSGAWDSLPELLALAQQSGPSEVALRNTGVGIFRMKTFGRTVRVRVKAVAMLGSESEGEIEGVSGGEGEGEREAEGREVEFRFDVDGGRGKAERPDYGIEYG